jgi:hypothetical protein
VITSSSDGFLLGVNIIEKGTSNGVQSDFDVNYTIKTESGKYLQFSFVGMQSKTLTIHSSIMNITMLDDLNALDEVVLTGYYGSTNNSSVSKLLRGQAAGV